MSKRRVVEITSVSNGQKRRKPIAPTAVYNSKYNGSGDDPDQAVDDDNLAADAVDDADDAEDSDAQLASAATVKSASARGAPSQSKEQNYNLRLRGKHELGGFRHMNGYGQTGSSYGSTLASIGDRQYWAPNSKRDHVAFQDRLAALKLLQREFADSISYPPEFAEALGLSSSRDACVATEFPDGVEEVKEEDTQMWYVERIIAHRKESHGTLYLVKWRGWPNSCNSWEPAESVYAPEQISMYFKKYGAKPPSTLRTVTFDQGGKIKKLDRIKASEIVEPKTRKR